MFCRERIIEAIFLYVLDYGDVIYKYASVSTSLHQSKSGDGLSLCPQIHYW